MSITRDNWRDHSQTGPTSPASISYTCSGTNRMLLVFAETAGTPNPITGITYNGVSLTLLKEQSWSSNNRFLSLWGLLNPATGSNTLTMTFTSGGADWTVASYNGVDTQATFPFASASSNFSSGNVTTVSVSVSANSNTAGFAQTALGSTVGSNINSVTLDSNPDLRGLAALEKLPTYVDQIGININVAAQAGIAAITVTALPNTNLRPKKLRPRVFGPGLAR